MNTVGWFIALAAAVCAAVGWIEAIRRHRIDETHLKQRDTARSALQVGHSEVGAQVVLLNSAKVANKVLSDANSIYRAQIADRDEEITRLKQQLADVQYEVKTPKRAKRAASAPTSNENLPPE